MKSYLIGYCMGVEVKTVTNGKTVATIAVKQGLDSEKFTVFQQDKGDNKLLKAVTDIGEGEPVLIVVNHYFTDGKERKFINEIYTGDDVLNIGLAITDLKNTA